MAGDNAMSTASGRPSLTCPTAECACQQQQQEHVGRSLQFSADLPVQPARAAEQNISRHRPR